MTRSYPHFTEAEFQRAQPPCSLEQMDDWFMQHLERARTLAGVPFIINSAYRSIDYEKAHGRLGTSAHTMGVAVDIAVRSLSERFRILSSLLAVGFSRIGIGKNFIHVDDSLTHRDNVIWLYE